MNEDSSKLIVKVLILSIVSHVCSLIAIGIIVMLLLRSEQQVKVIVVNQDGVVYGESEDSSSVEDVFEDVSIDPIVTHAENVVESAEIDIAKAHAEIKALEFMETFEEETEEDLEEDKPQVLGVTKEKDQTRYIPTGVLSKTMGVNYFNGQKETYYNLPMSRVVSNAQEAGLEGDYWVREDGCKMFGDYIMIAAHQGIHPYGSLVETSLGTGIVVDTGSFIYDNQYQVDIAVNW